MLSNRFDSYGTMKKWSEEVWELAAPTYGKIIEHPFITELSAGSLPQEKFRFYLRQDALYLENYARILSHIASRLPDKGHVTSFINFASAGIVVEKELHASCLGGEIPPVSEISPSCLLYSSVLQSFATAPVEVEAAAILPCFWVYNRVGKEILSMQTGDGNPYSRWIGTYADEGFTASTLRAVEICDALAHGTGKATRERMTDAFLLCTKMEWMFWDSAWEMEKWKI